MEIMKNHMISYGVNGCEKESGKFILEKSKQIGKKILSSTGILNRSDIKKVLFMIESNKLDMFR